MLMYESTTVHLGTRDNDHLAAGPGSHYLVGLAGNDTLVSRWDDVYWSEISLAGGTGNDTYHALADVTSIIDSGGNDTLHVPGYAGEFVGGFLEGKDLILVNEWTGQSLYIYDFKGAGRIETFVDHSGQRMSASEVERSVYRDGLGDLGYRDMQYLTGDYSLSEQEFWAVREIDIGLGSLDWEPVFQTLAQQGNSTGWAVAQAIEAQLLPTLSSQAQQLWQDTHAFQALAHSDYLGLEQNLPPANLPLVARDIAENIGLLYEAALNRMPEQEGFNYWTEQAARGMEMREIALRFLDSDEFRFNFDTTTDENFIEALNGNVLGRSPDAAGEAFWLGEMSDGMPAVEVLSRFADSPENRNQAEWMSGLQLDDASGHWLLA